MANINDLLNLFSGEMEKKALADAYNFAVIFLKWLILKFNWFIIVVYLLHII